MSKPHFAKYRLVWEKAKILYDSTADHGDCGLWLGEPCRIVAARGNAGRAGLCYAKPLPSSRVRIGQDGSLEIRIRKFIVKEWHKS